MPSFGPRRPRSASHAARVGALSCLLALVPASGRADEPPPAAPPADVSGQVPDVVVEAPEPRYVAPTRRDKIGRIWAPVLINDKGPFRLVLDTGATNSAVTAAVAATLGLTPTNEHSVMLRGVTGSRQVPTISIDSLVVGDLELRSKRLPIVVDALGGAEGVLGTEGLQDKRIYIDFRHDKITIFRSHQQRPPPGFVVIPVHIENGLLLIADIRVGTVRAKAIIDTGGQATLANVPMREALEKRLRAEDIKADEVTGATLDVQLGDRVAMPPIRIGELTIRGANITVGDMFIFQHWKMTKEPALLIGMDVLGLLDTMIIDYRRHELQVLQRGAGSG
ncbi:MAG: aspartyl protease family protein [Proteobacteria bacterium]|nr:aspartyl protease family protein [Pseudomonadota bacterium]